MFTVFWLLCHAIWQQVFLVPDCGAGQNSVLFVTRIQARFCVGAGGITPKPRPCTSSNVTWNTVWRTQCIGMYKKKHYVTFKIHQNAFAAGAPSRTPPGNSQRYPGPLIGWWGDTLLHAHTTLRRWHLESSAYGAHHSAPRFGWQCPLQIAPPYIFSLEPCLQNLVPTISS